jgi:hypothetical protein
MQVKLRDVATITNAYPLRTAIDADPNGTHLAVQAKDVDSNYRLRPSALTRFIPSADLSQYRVSAGDIVFTTRSRYGAAVVDGVPRDTVAAGSLYILRVDAARVQPSFLAWYFRHPDVQGELRARQSGVSIPFLRLSELGDFPISLPPLATQQAIAEIEALRQREVDLNHQIAERRAHLLNHALMQKARTTKE